MKKVKVGLCGTGFVGHLHAYSMQRCPEAEITAVHVYSRDLARGRQFAREFGGLEVFTDFDQMLKRAEVDLITLGIPNDLHASFTVKAARAGKHVFVEKPLCLTLDEADRMIAACRKAGVKLFYGENLCFAPKYVRARELVKEGALGKVFLVKQRESHFGPHAAWFWDVRRSGGGAFMDMGCHGIEFARWILGKPRVKRVFCSLGRFTHLKKTRGEDDSVAIVEFEGGARAVLENSWALRGGLDDRAEITGTLGVTYADLVYGSALRTYSVPGYGYAVEKAPDTRGWSFTIYQEHEMYGHPAEMVHVVECIQKNRKPIETGEDGRQVLEALFAGYASARLGRWVNLPFKPPKGKKPYQLWLGK
jgi:predicted dehydrogenase